MTKLMKFVGGIIGTGARAFVALVGVAGISLAIANYTMTQGSGTTFGSVVVSTVHYAQQLICDLTTPSQCAAVDSAGNVATKHVSGAVASGAFASGSLATGAIVDMGAPGATACASDTASCNQNQQLQRIAQNLTTINGNVVQAPYPAGATPYTATATGTTGATTATLAGAASVTTYICWLSIRSNATAVATGNATVTGIITATLNFTHWTAVNTSGLGITEMIFSPCIPASAANTSIAVVSPAPGAGGVVSVSAGGFKL